jgi:hypothetical protein
MIPKTQEFIFDMMLKPTLEAVKESGNDGLPLLLCPEEYLSDFVEYLRQERVKQIFDEVGFFPIIQTVEKHQEQELNHFQNGFTQSLILICLLVRENSTLSQSHLLSLRLESAEIFNRCTPKELATFLDRHIGFLIKEDKSGFN